MLGKSQRSLLLLLSFFLCMPSLGWGQSFPIHSIRIIIPFAPGGGTDNLTRIMAPRLNELLGQSVVIDNRPGASGQIGTDMVAKSAPDGYTVAHVDTSFTSNPSLYGKLPYDSVKDFAPVSLLASAPVVLIVHPSVPAQNLKQLLKYARTNPGQLNFATGGAGSATHLGFELMKSVAGINLVHIPYKGSGPAASAVLTGQVMMMMASPSATRQHILASKLRALAITGNRRNPALPAVMTFSEEGLPGIDAGTYWVEIAPATTARDILNVLNSALVRVLHMADIRKRLIDLGFDPLGTTPEECAANIQAELAKWSRVVTSAKIKIE